MTTRYQVRRGSLCAPAGEERQRQRGAVAGGLQYPGVERAVLTVQAETEVPGLDAERRAAGCRRRADQRGGERKSRLPAAVHADDQAEAIASAEHAPE